MGAFFVFGGNRYGVALSIHRRWAGGVLVYVSETVRGLHKAVAVGMGGRGHDRQLLFPVTGHEDAAHGHRLRHLDGYRRPGRRHRGHSGFSGARHRPAAHFRGAAARRGLFYVFTLSAGSSGIPRHRAAAPPSAHSLPTAPGSLRRSTAAYTPPRRPGTRRRRYAW